MSKSYSHFFSKKFQHICVSLNVNFNESLTNDVISFEQLSKKFQHICVSLNVNFNESLTIDVISFEQLGPDVLLHF